MRVVHLNTTDIGGAAVAALRLHQGLLEQGIDSLFLSLYKHNDAVKSKIKYAGPYSKKPFLQKIKRRIIRNMEGQYQRNLKMLPPTQGNYEIYSFPLTDFCVEENTLVQSADIIHLHWVADFINFPTFFKALDKPVVWTLHDMNPFQGGFHYLEDKNRNKDFDTIEQRMLNIKKEALFHLERIAIVTPSVWMGEAAKSSKVFKNASFKHIPYGLPLTTFKQHNPLFARQVFDLPPDKKIMMFASENINTYRKGFDVLLKAIETLDETSDFILVTIGQVSEAFVNKPFLHHIGKINDERLMSLLFSCADLFILPSREDNLPNVMLESFACGTPVLSFKTGGMAECIKPGMNGFFSESISAESLLAAIKMFCNGYFSFDRNKIRENASNEFSLEKQAQKYIELYKSSTG